MCLSAEALALFLNLLAADLVTTEPERITVAAEAGDVVWTPRGTAWCTDAPDAARAIPDDPG